MKFNVVIRVDASVQIGAGHFSRCLVLADYLGSKGAKVKFICREVLPGLEQTAQSRGHSVSLLKEHEHWKENKDAREFLEAAGEEVDLVVVDHYHLTSVWELVVRRQIPELLVIDDLANRLHDCDILLDQNYVIGHAERYRTLVPKRCIMLTGPRYALLQPEFFANRSINRNGKEARRLLISYGSTDPTGETLKALDALDLIRWQFEQIDIVVGPGNPALERVRERVGRLRNAALHVGTTLMAALMRAADVSLGSGGVTTWERCISGLPAIVTIIAENQRAGTEAAAAAGALINLGFHSDVTGAAIASAIDALCPDVLRLTEMEKNARALMDDSGPKALEKVWTAVSKTARELSPEAVRLRLMTLGDREQVFEWRNSDRVRAAMFDSSIIEREQHDSWFKKVLEATNSWYYVCEFRGVPYGLVYFPKVSSEGRTEWGFYVGRPDAPQGLGTAMCRAGLERAFSSLPVNLIVGEVLRTNEASLALHRRLGFKANGVVGTQQRGERSIEIEGFSMSLERWEELKTSLDKGVAAGQ